jgi:hypothetical protein
MCFSYSPTFPESIIGNIADAPSERGREGRTDGQAERGRRPREDPDAHVPPLLEAVAPANYRDSLLPGVQVAELEHAAADADSPARMSPLRSHVEAAAGDADDLSEV